MARDPADVLAELRYNATHRTGDTWAGLTHDDPTRARYFDVARRYLAALDAAGYEVRPKADARSLSPAVIDALARESNDDPIEEEDVHWYRACAIEMARRYLAATTAVPITDGDDPDQPDHRGEPEGDPSP